MNIDENILIEIFLTRSNKQIKTIVNNYSKCKFIMILIKSLFLLIYYLKYLKIHLNKI
jgi:hypothetical protein